MSMRLKQMLATVGIVVVLFVMLYPTIVTGMLTIQLNAQLDGEFDHVYLTLREVSVHKAGTSEIEGWIIISNTTQTLSIVTMQNLTNIIAQNRLRIGEYDKIRVRFTNASTPVNNTELKLEIELQEYTIPIEFLCRAYQETRILLDAHAIVKRVAKSGILYLTFKARVL
jgi:hypothetical protein